MHLSSVKTEKEVFWLSQNLICPYKLSSNRRRMITETDLLTHVTRALSINSFIGSDAMLVLTVGFYTKKNHCRHSHHITIRLCRPHSHWIIYHNQIYTISLLNNYSKITFTFSLIRAREGDAHFPSQREEWHWATSLSGPQLRSMVEKCRTDIRWFCYSYLGNICYFYFIVYWVLSMYF